MATAAAPDYEALRFCPPHCMRRQVQGNHLMLALSCGISDGQLRELPMLLKVSCVISIPMRFSAY